MKSLKSRSAPHFKFNWWENLRTPSHNKKEKIKKKKRKKNKNQRNFGLSKSCVSRRYAWESVEVCCETLLISLSKQKGNKSSRVQTVGVKLLAKKALKLQWAYCRAKDGYWSSGWRRGNFSAFYPSKRPVLHQTLEFGLCRMEVCFLIACCRLCDV